MSGLGAAAADALYGLVAVMGVSVVSVFLLDHQYWIQLWSGIFLFLLGWKTYTSKVETFMTDQSKTTSSLKGFLSVFLVTLTNPMTIFAFIAIFGVFRVTASGDSLSALLVVSGVFCGSALWWGLIAMVGGWLSSWMEPDSLRVINRVSGIIMTIFSAYFLIDLI